MKTTVASLIALLEKCPPDYMVTFCDRDEEFTTAYGKVFEKAKVLAFFLKRESRSEK